MLPVSWLTRLRRELVALADGYRESTASWADLLRDCARRGMRAPRWSAPGRCDSAALREVFPDTREQRDRVHKTANVLAALPPSAHPGAKAGPAGRGPNGGAGLPPRSTPQ